MVFIGLALHFPLWLAVLLAAVIAAGKESAESIWGVWEPVQPWANGEKDFEFFVIGITIALFLHLV